MNAIDDEPYGFQEEDNPGTPWEWWMDVLKDFAADIWAKCRPWVIVTLLILVL